MKNKKIVIFDLDDTLISSDAKINIFDCETNDLLHSLTPSQFNYHVRGSAQYCNFDDFDCEKILGKSRILKNSFRSFKRYYDNQTPLSIITARSNKKIIIDFLKSKNITLKPSLIYAVSNPDSGFTGNISQRKKQAIQDLIHKGYRDIVFYDDNLENLTVATELINEFISIKIIHVSHDKKTRKNWKSKSRNSTRN